VAIPGRGYGTTDLKSSFSTIIIHCHYILFTGLTASAEWINRVVTNGKKIGPPPNPPPQVSMNSISINSIKKLAGAGNNAVQAWRCRYVAEESSGQPCHAGSVDSWRRGYKLCYAVPLHGGGELWSTLPRRSGGGPAVGTPASTLGHKMRG
jgi:hypothetical protein